MGNAAVHDHGGQKGITKRKRDQVNRINDITATLSNVESGDKYDASSKTTEGRRTDR